MFKWSHAYLLLLALVILSCGGKQVVVTQYQNEQIAVKEVSSDAAVEEIVQPYKEALDDRMNAVLATSEINLIKARPESTLGNLLADVLYEEASALVDTDVDFAILNYGGIRVPGLDKGPITLGNVYEVMPFDNFLVVMEIDGPTLSSVFDHMAAKGGWPISKQVNYAISDGKAINIQIKGKPFDITKSYHVVLSDYLANGGDQMAMLKSITPINTNVLVRDAMINYFQRAGEEGKAITAEIENRIVEDAE